MTASRLGLRLGIIGGLGPLASADFYRKLTELTPARTDTDHLPLVLLSLPQLPDRTEAILNGSDAVLDALMDAVSTLDKLGVERIAIPCNTAHHWFDALSRATRAKIVHIVDSVVEEMAQFPGARRVTLLATRGTLASGFYQNALLAADHEIYAPRRQDFQNLVDAAIRDVKSGALADAATALNSALARCREESVDVTILACTELSAISHRIDTDPSGIVDSNTALARTCLRQLGLLTKPDRAREARTAARSTG
ncbi:aspartate/glutamate racemase family protein [Kaistia terrae]|uniref:Aspartate/glutamate racemase family protein n=1 Tax=Kaistia terrae TaxID=537017 RepID=A0ABW0Q1U0_9HYPH|nr:amino acid racemase [Kaistia terrae]MCX5579726.1 amino acid racemase [Kaistia terrae]